MSVCLSIYGYQIIMAYCTHIVYVECLSPRLEEAYGEARNEQKFIKAEADRIATVLVGGWWWWCSLVVTDWLAD